MATTFDFGDGNGPVPARRHVNPGGIEGGWVADTAMVEPTAYVGFDARVYGNARVCNEAWVHDDATVYGNAEVCDKTWIRGNAEVYGNARVCDEAWVFGDARVFGDAEVYGNARVLGDVTVCGHADIDDGEFSSGIVDCTPEAGEPGFYRQVTKDDGSFVRYDADGKVHCDGSPAVRDSDGNETWYEHGRKLEGPKPGMDRGPVSARFSPRT